MSPHQPLPYRPEAGDLLGMVWEVLFGARHKLPLFEQRQFGGQGVGAQLPATQGRFVLYFLAVLGIGFYLKNFYEDFENEALVIDNLLPGGREALPGARNRG